MATSLFDRFFPGANKPNTSQGPAQFSADHFAQTHDPTAPGYENPANYYTNNRDTLQHNAQLGSYYDDQAYGIQRLQQALGMGGSSGGGFTGGGGGGAAGGVAGGVSMPGPVNYADNMPTPIPGVEAPDMTAANAQIFGRAKDQAGQTARASLQSLRDELGASGMLGSGGEVQGTRDIVSRGMGQLGEVSRENAVNESAQKADFAKMKYQGDITQRGQDIAAQEAAARLALAREQSKQQLLLAALQGLGGGGGTSRLPSTSLPKTGSPATNPGVWVGQY